MKKLMAVLLTGCLTFQTWMGAVVPVKAAEFSAASDVDVFTEAPASGTEEAPDVNQDTDSVENVVEDDDTDIFSETTEPEEAPVVPVDGETQNPEDAVEVFSGESEEDVFGTGEEEIFGDESLLEAGNLQNTGALEVKVTSALPFQYLASGVPVTVSIQSGSFTDTKTITISGKDASSAAAEFEGLAPGTYIVTVSAAKFARYTQEVPVQSQFMSKIQVCSAKVQTGTNAKPGWIPLGDVTGDEKIGQSDIDKILNAIRTNPYGDTTANLNVGVDNPEKVDIADLQYAVQAVGESPQTSNVEKLAMPLKVAAEENTVVQGNLESILEEEGSVTLQTAGGAVISPENPVAVTFDLAPEEAVGEELPKLAGITIQTAQEDGTASSDITSGIVEYTYVDADGEKTGSIPFNVPNLSREAEFAPELMFAASASEPSFYATGSYVTVDADGSLTLDFGQQIAVKRITIKITGTRKQEPLVKIASVEFVNNMEDRIPAPQLDIPAFIGDRIVVGNEEIMTAWTPQRNVTGYDVLVSGPVKKQTEIETQIVRVFGTEHRITSINDKPLKNYGEYTLQVRSVNGDWTSAWSNAIKAVPKPTSRPAPPDFVTAEPGYRSIKVTWKNMDDANGYMVYYTEATEDSYKPVVEGFTETKDGTGRLSGNSYTITGLQDNVQYKVCVKSWNEIDWGDASMPSLATTESADTPQLPNYRLINTPNGTGVLTSHIQTATLGGAGKASMVESVLDAGAATALGVVDNSYISYWRKADWDDGAYNAGNLSNGVTITFDQEYKMNYLTFAAAGQKVGVNLAKVRYWNAQTGSSFKLAQVGVSEKRDANNNPYYIVKFSTPITANKLQLCVGRNWVDRSEMKIGEIHFHTYDPLEDEIAALYVDEMNTMLAENVTEETIQALEERLEAGENGEKHPLYDSLKLELANARELLNAGLDETCVVDSRITARKDGHLGFGGLNAWQPLGRVAYAGESLLVYVGHNTRKPGQNADLQLVFTQYHAEANSLARTVNLKVGKNEITVPQVAGKDFERGGQLYIAYTGNNASDQYGVRVKGGVKIPSLNIYKKTGADKRAAIEKYIEELGAYVSSIAEKHESFHAGNKNVNYAFDTQNCILNATDIMMEKMMYSVPATKVWENLSGASDPAGKLETALDAMEQTMTLFYHHKGLSDSAGTARGSNALPSQHLNIRYMRMFAGAFMYASGNHIGIEWGSTGIVSGAGSWDSFGWGIAHEIGHNINQGTYAIAEITNNYFAQLLTKAVSGTRFTYDSVYKKVTSGAVGRADQRTQLALYWQLHLAFDNGADRQIYDNYEDQFQNLFFARVDTYSRNPGKAPQAGLTLGSNVDQNLMRLSCAAANKNILPFFKRWGMTPDADTTSYAAKYGAEDTKALYYVNDEARDYRVSHSGEAGSVKDQAVVTASANANGNQVVVTINTSADPGVILGYEIIRSMTSNGETASRVVGFVPSAGVTTTFTDTISTMNNRVMSYEVKAVDKFLNYSKAANAGSVKVETGGALNKAAWTVETTMTSADDTAVVPGEDDPDSGYNAGNPLNTAQKYVHSIDRIIDNDHGTVYNGNSGETAEITIDMHRTEEVTSLKYKGSSLSNVTVLVSANGTDWTTVKQNYDGCTAGEDKFATIWFDSVKVENRSNWIGTYNARYVKLVIGQAGGIRISEIEICGPSGDNLEFKTADGQMAVGVLKADYQYGQEAADVIPAGSLIFTGEYKGNPAYNVVILYDTQGNVIGANGNQVNAQQVIFADVPANGNLGETSNGTWVYYLTPENWTSEGIKTIQGVRGELYRVDDALTLEGERIVSDTLLLTLPETLPEITLTGSRPDGQ